MEELVEEHRWGRKVTARLVEANARYVQGKKEALSPIMDSIRSLVEFYPTHIKKRISISSSPVWIISRKQKRGDVERRVGVR